jgi:hypothetical protein
MAEYIEREAIIKLITSRYENPELCTQEINSIPAADVAPVVHGTPMLRYRPERYERYEEQGLDENGEMLYLKRTLVDEKSYAMYCPCCGKRLCSRFKDYCPHCGAKMDGGKA